MTDTPNPAEPTPDRIRQLEEQVRRLEQERNQARLERDDYLDLLRMVAPELALTPQDLETATPTGPWFEEMISQLRAGSKK